MMARTSREADGYIAAAMNAIAREMDARDLLAGLYRDPLRAASDDILTARGAVDRAEIGVERLQVLVRDLLMDADRCASCKATLFQIQQDLFLARQRCGQADCHITHVHHGVRALIVRLHHAIEREKCVCAATSSAGHYEAAEAAVYA